MFLRALLLVRGPLWYFSIARTIRPEQPFPLMDNGLRLGTLPEGNYSSYNANPGIHEFALATNTTALQRLKLEAGATSYIKADVSKDPLQFRPSLAVAFELQGKSDIEQLQRLRYYE
ncbi:MAG TPA: hypothetical protein VFO40_21320 [Chthoniobacterales bacterium]|nr:hypothetical protein [Chthoniobacterales bacterium]